jgi:hypothetical protein
MTTLQDEYNSHKKTGGPAFPYAVHELWIDEKTGNIVKGDETEVQGMTLRDYFAAKAMERFMDEWIEEVRAGKYNEALEGNLDDDSCYHIIAHDAYAMADAMLKAREQ